jgi:thioredoxin
VKKVTDATFATAVLAAEKPVLVDFSAAWCGPCRVQKPVLERFAAEHPELDVVYVDIDESPRAAREHGVQAVPTLMLFVGGQRKATTQGLQSAARLAGFVESARPARAS